MGYFRLKLKSVHLSVCAPHPLQIKTLMHANVPTFNTRGPTVACLRRPRKRAFANVCRRAIIRHIQHRSFACQAWCKARQHSWSPDKRSARVRRARVHVWEERERGPRSRRAATPRDVVTPAADVLRLFVNHERFRCETDVWNAKSVNLWLLTGLPRWVYHQCVCVA